MLYELLAGKRAFQGQSLSDTLASVLKEEPDWSALPAQTPAAIRTLLQHCLRKDRKQRLQAIGDARIAIEDVLAEVTPAGEPAPAAGFRRSILPWVAAAGVLAIVAAIGWWTAWRSARPVDNSLMRLSVDLGPDAIAGDPGTEGADDPFFSPDGRWIGFFAAGKMKKVSVRDSAVVVLCDAPSGRGAAWGDDDNIIATLSGGSGVGLSRVPAAGGTPQAVTTPGSKGDATDRFSSMEVLSLKTGKVKVVQRGGYFGRYLPGGYLVYLHQRTLFGVPFDLERLEVRGTPAPLLEDVAGDSNTAGGQFDFSRNGRFVYLSGKSSTGTWVMAWLDGAGKIQPLPPDRQYITSRGFLRTVSGWRFPMARISRDLRPGARNKDAPHLCGPGG